MSISGPTSLYALGSAEHERLIHQAAPLAPLTERFLREACIGPGQRILELGSGVGDVANAGDPAGRSFTRPILGAAITGTSMLSLHTR
jgi:hypothetical protein